MSRGGGERWKLKESEGYYSPQRQSSKMAAAVALTDSFLIWL